MATTQAMVQKSKRTARTTAPDFLLLGAAKCGTTSLHAWLEQHPQILMSSPKEPTFFEMEYEKGVDYYLSKYFEPDHRGRLLGDSRTRNLFLPWIPERVHECNPDAKLVVMVRNPIDRCLSHWWMHFSRDRDPLEFEEAVLADIDRIERGLRHETEDEYIAYQKAANLRGIYRTYIDTGYYAEQLQRYRRLFRDRQIRIFDLDDIKKRPLAVLQELCDFLGVSHEPLPAIRLGLENGARLMKHRLAVPYWLKRRREGRPAPYTEVRRCPKMRPQFRQFLADHFRAANAELSLLINRDLTHWS
jgi:hypothetical protein